MSNRIFIAPFSLASAKTAMEKRGLKLVSVEHDAIRECPTPVEDFLMNFWKYKLLRPLVALGMSLLAVCLFVWGLFAVFVYPRRNETLLAETKEQSDSAREIIDEQELEGLPHFEGHMAWKAGAIEELRSEVKLDPASEKLLGYLQVGRPFFGGRFSDDAAEWNTYAYLTRDEVRHLLGALDQAHDNKNGFLRDFKEALRSVADKQADLYFRASAEYF